MSNMSFPVAHLIGLVAPVITTSGDNRANRRLGCVGTVLPGLTLAIVNPDTYEDVPVGSEGEVNGLCPSYSYSSVSLLTVDCHRRFAYLAGA